MPDTPKPNELLPGAGSPLVAGPPQGLIVRKASGGAIYPYSRKNFGGIIAAVAISAILLLTGIGGPFWPLIAIVVYLVVAVAVPNKARPKLRNFGPDGIHDAMQAQLRAMSGKVPSDVYGKVATIHAAILELLPRIDRLPPGSEDLYILRRIPLDYLPTTLEDYLTLPRSYASVGAGRGTKPPKQLLMEQLDLLEGKLAEISNDINAADADRLAANGRFLQDRFGTRDLELP